MKIHIVLLDDRFAYDLKTGDRLGEDQWTWFETALRN